MTYSNQQLNIVNNTTPSMDIFSDTETKTHQDTVSESESIFHTLTINEEKKQLAQWKTPPEVLYNGKAWDMLTAIDQNEIHLYSTLVNWWLKHLFTLNQIKIIDDCPKLRECLQYSKYRLDIWTWNWIVSNMAALAMHMPAQHIKFNAKGNARMAQMDAMIEAHKSWSVVPSLENTKEVCYEWKVHFVSCDLSKSSLNSAKESAFWPTHHIHKLYNLEYYADTFQKFLANEDLGERPRLITMFNMLANFELDDLKEIMTEVHDSMKESDVFIPSFFLEEKNDYESYGRYYDTYWLWDFRTLTKYLYANKETRNRATSSFSERYNIPQWHMLYDVKRKNDWRSYISADLHTSSETTMTIDWEETTAWEILWHNESQSVATFNVLKSYRMSKQYIRELCESLWFGIENRIEWQNWLSIAPVLYKKAAA